MLQITKLRFASLILENLLSVNDLTQQFDCSDVWMRTADEVNKTKHLNLRLSMTSYMIYKNWLVDRDITS